MKRDGYDDDGGGDGGGGGQIECGGGGQIESGMRPRPQHSGEKEEGRKEGRKEGRGPGSLARSLGLIEQFVASE